jgi:hypothetical protein
VKHLQAAGFSVETESVQNLDELAARRKVPAELRSCHTATLAGYLIEGHVPASVIKRLLRERPKIAGIGVAGMPAGSPGMESPAPVAYEVLAWRPSGEMFVYASVDADGTVHRGHRR